MTKLEYLIFLRSNKGILFKDESRFCEVTNEDKEVLLKYRYIEIDDDIISITEAGERYLDSLE